ncbi:AsnC family transcriptional regulator [Sinorhizobium americanum]|uniref:AsnC family transcriptional regulator n=1 Tax=Sinorhizobium americanum TaxID=194963 RepID=A0A2S3YMN1_9HYPH|nr:AsnC family transcriptional regulator [Sinorhizobium americanum]POH31525.1 AsnC family transcriptional regulator [Sinorhizobium americanum]
MCPAQAAEDDELTELDEKDRLLLAALHKDSRQSLVALARHAGLSRSATHERLRRLETRGAIAAYTIRLGAEQKAPMVRALVAVAFHPGKNCDHVVPHLSGMPHVVSCWSLAGATDLMLLVECDSNDDLDMIRRRIAIIPGVATVQTHVTLRTHFDRRG